VPTTNGGLCRISQFPSTFDRHARLNTYLPGFRSFAFYILILGGASIVEVGISTVEQYDPTTDTWTTKSPMPTPRWGFAACTVNGKIYAIGGA